MVFPVGQRQCRENSLHYDFALEKRRKTSLLNKRVTTSGSLRQIAIAIWNFRFAGLKSARPAEILIFEKHLRPRDPMLPRRPNLRIFLRLDLLYSHEAYSELAGG